MSWKRQQQAVAKRAEGAALKAQLEQEQAIVEVRACSSLCCLVQGMC